VRKFRVDAKPKVITRTLAALTTFALIVYLPCAYGVHLYQNFLKIQTDFRKSVDQTVRPVEDDESVSEIGYLYSMQRETHIRRGEFNLVWFIAVPATGKRYSCSYQAGSPDFAVGDGVRIIHKKSDVVNEGYTGYLIGLHQRNAGKVAEVRALDSDELGVGEPD
jgi:hypothetical protein